MRLTTNSFRSRAPGLTLAVHLLKGHGMDSGSCPDWPKHGSSLLYLECWDRSRLLGVDLRTMARFLYGSCSPFSRGCCGMSELNGHRFSLRPPEMVLPPASLVCVFLSGRDLHLLIRSRPVTGAGRVGHAHQSRFFSNTVGGSCLFESIRQYFMG